VHDRAVSELVDSSLSKKFFVYEDRVVTGGVTTSYHEEKSLHGLVPLRALETKLDEEVVYGVR